jgi:hypothetical protein
MCCGRCRRRVWDRDAMRRLSSGDEVDYGLRRSFGALTGAEIRQVDPARLRQELLRRPPPSIGFGEVKSQAGMNQGLHQIMEGLHDIAHTIPAGQGIQYPRVGLAWYLPNNMVRYMVAQPNVDPRLSRRIWQGNIGRIRPVPASVTAGARTPQQVIDREAAWREQQVRNLLHSVTGQPFRSLPIGHRGHDLQPLPVTSTLPAVLGRNFVLGGNRFDALDEAIDEALEYAYV